MYCQKAFTELNEDRVCKSFNISNLKYYKLTLSLSCFRA